MSNRSRSAQEQFGRQAALYATSRPHATGESLDLLVQWAEPRPTDRLLDVATGTGFTALAFAPHVRLAVGLDPTPQMLAQAARLAGARGLDNVILVRSVAEAMPFADASFDLVTCRVAPHHFDSVPAFLDEARRVVRPGGLVLVADSSAPDHPGACAWQETVERLRDPSHVHSLSTPEWVAAFTAAGLAVERHTCECRTQLLFSDWVRTAGVDQPTIARLRGLFDGADAATRAAFTFEERDGDVHFSWPVTVVRARRPS
ncbi:MAG: methyltransferase domain-containing protein [Chloroflexi bacterium]|nr:methyltransferase domain-containing protein [Chloroflexota bacterium]